MQKYRDIRNQSKSNDVQPTARKAAMYVRMSTDHQKYSTENQADAIRDYAAHHNIEIIKTYADEGKSGLRIDGRDALKQLEAFIACGQKHIPAVVIDVTKEQAMIMSLVENLARRHHRALDLMQSLEILKKQGYSAQTISAKTGLNEEHVKGVLHLMKNGEERLISAVEAGHIPITTAVMIADTPNEEIQKALQEAYETNQLRGQRLLMAKQLIEKRQRRGKTFLPSGGHKKKSDSKRISASDVLKAYQKEVDRKRMLARKAEIASSKLVFVTEALWRLLKEDNFVTLLKAEGLKTMPKQLSDLLDARG